MGKCNFITAPEEIKLPEFCVKIFLAGGICGCIPWQKMLMDKFSKLKPVDDCYIFNPRREDWLDKPGEDVRQITWEFNMLENSNMFTMYFDGSESLQPICQYELGRNIVRMQQKYPDTWKDRIVITCNSKYKRVKDVIIQTWLATNGLVKVNVVDGEEESVESHFNSICEKLKTFKLL